MQYLFWAFYPVFKLGGMWNTLSQVARAMIAVSRDGYSRHAIEVKDITFLSKAK